MFLHFAVRVCGMCEAGLVSMSGVRGSGTFERPCGPRGAERSVPFEIRMLEYFRACSSDVLIAFIVIY